MQYLEETKLTYHEIDNVSLATHALNERSQVEQHVQYINHLSSDVTVVGRNGVPFTLPPTGRRHDEFLIRITYRIDPSVKVDQANQFNRYANDNAEGRALREAIALLESGKLPTVMGKREFSLEYRVTRNEIVENGGVLYLADLDLVVSAVRDPSVAIHPYSSASSRYRLIESEVNVNNTESFGYAMYLVSNDGAVKDKFVNIGGEVYRVPSVKNQSLRDGVYICSSGPVTNDVRFPMPREIHYTFEKAKQELRLYETVEEASALGDALAARELELEEVKLAYKELEHKHKQEKLAFEAEYETRKKQLEMENMERQRSMQVVEHDRQMRQMREKDIYESRSTARKDSSEAIKFIPVAIGGALAIAALVMKFRS